MRDGNQTELMRKDGYVRAVEVARATGRDLTAVHKEIEAEKIPGGRFGWGWYVDIHRYVDKVRKAGTFPEDGTIMTRLEELRGTVAAPAGKPLPAAKRTKQKRRAS